MPPSLPGKALGRNAETLLLAILKHGPRRGWWIVRVLSGQDFNGLSTGTSENGMTAVLNSSPEGCLSLG
jgi:hypothetical protein